MTREAFQKFLGSGLIFLDGATGTNFMKAGLPRGACTEVWALEHPEVVRSLQSAYLDAGSQILYAPTFSANALALKSFGLADQLERLNTQLVRLSKDIAGDRALVAGDITTIGRPLAPYGDLDYETALSVYQQQIRLLAQAGADLIVAETLMGVGEAAVAVEACLSVCDLPIICSLSLETDGKAFFDGDGLEAVETLQALGASAVGVNCSQGPDQLVSLVANMHRIASVPIIAKPNAGLPYIDDAGQAVYTMGPDAFASHMQALVDAGATLVGGCCGTTPEHIAAMRRTLKLQNPA